MSGLFDNLYVAEETPQKNDDHNNSGGSQQPPVSPDAPQDASGNPSPAPAAENEPLKDADMGQEESKE